VNKVQTLISRKEFMKLQPKTIALLVVLALFVIVLFQNSDATSIELLFWDLVNIPLFVLILSTIILGWVMGWITHMAYQKGKKNQAAKTSPNVEPPKENTDKETPAGTEANP